MKNNSQNTNQVFLSEYFGQVRQTLIYLLAWGTVVVLSACLAGNIFLIPGFLFGFAANVLYYILLCLRVKKSADMPPQQAIIYMRYGWIIRLGFILAVLVIGVKLPGIEFWAVALGLFSLKIVLIMQAVVIVTKGLITRLQQRP